MHENDFEPIELTNMIMIEKDGRILLQNQHKYESWQGWVLPGGHVDKGESFVRSAIREAREETGLTILDPRLVGVKQFPKAFSFHEGSAPVNGRYIVFFFKATQYTGELHSSAEGEMRWFTREEIKSLQTVNDFDEMFKVFEEPEISEFQYIPDADGTWIPHFF